MAQLTTAGLEELPSSYESLRALGEVLLGEDDARLLIKASSSSNDPELRSLLSQPQWVKTMLEKPHCNYGERRGPNGERKVMAVQMSNVERALAAATENGHAAVASTLLAFATQQSIDSSEIITRLIIYKTIIGGHPAVYKTLASTDPNVINFLLPHGTLPLYEAARRRKTDVVAVLLELGADPLHPVELSKSLWSYN